MKPVEGLRSSSRRGRLLKFSLVGALGIAVQLATLSALHAAGINYLVATGCAVEAAVLHNFLWHRRFTWADRWRDAGANATRSLIRFHLSSGLISLMGNLLVMRVCAGWLHLPLVLANVLAISICWLANFMISDYWVFGI